ncbi:MAG: PilZ domain-containing protein [Calditrichota bacterium]
MNPKEYLHIRDAVELIIGGSDRDIVFTVRVQEIAADGFYIDRPIIDRSVYSVGRGSEVMVYYQRNKVSYRFTTRIISETMLGRLPVVKLEHPRELERIQRRKHARLEFDIPVFFRRLLPSPDNQQELNQRGRIIDISAGGLKFAAVTPKIKSIIAGDKLQVSFQLAREVTLREQPAQVLKVSLDPDDDELSWLVCSFINLPRDVQEAIVIYNIRWMKRYRVETK